MEHLVTPSFAERVRQEYARLLRHGASTGEAVSVLAETWCSNQRLLMSLLQDDTPASA